MQRDAFISVIISAICMLIYIAIRFKDVKFGSSAINVPPTDNLPIEYALALIVGVIGGAFSSVFLTGPLWYMMKTRMGSDAIKESNGQTSVQPEKITANPNRKKKKKKKRK